LPERKPSSGKKPTPWKIKIKKPRKKKEKKNNRVKWPKKKTQKDQEGKK